MGQKGGPGAHHCAPRWAWSSSRPRARISGSRIRSLTVLSTFRHLVRRPDQPARTSASHWRAVDRAHARTRTHARARTQPPRAAAGGAVRTLPNGHHPPPPAHARWSRSEARGGGRREGGVLSQAGVSEPAPSGTTPEVSPAISRSQTTGYDPAGTSSGLRGHPGLKSTQRQMR